MLNVKLFEGNTEDDPIGIVLHEAGAEVDFISQVQVEEDTSPSGLSLMAISTIGVVGFSPCLWDFFTIFRDKDRDAFPWIRPGIDGEVDPPSSTDAGHKLASVDINTRRISLQTKLAGVEQFAVRDSGVWGIKIVLVTAKISKGRILNFFYLLQ